jgi:hypothetical protein
MSACECCISPGEGGSGGAGYGAGGDPGSAGDFDCGVGYQGVSANPGTLTAGGAAINKYGVASGAPFNGAGGALGSAGDVVRYQGNPYNVGNEGTPGSGGAAIAGNSYITWVATGTRSGAINS